MGPFSIISSSCRKTIKAGGCNCSRSFFIGAMMGAKHGITGIPRYDILTIENQTNKYRDGKMDKKIRTIILIYKHRTLGKKTMQVKYLKKDT